MKKITIINGPNLNLLGKREEAYGALSLNEIKKETEHKLLNLAELTWFESNKEDEIVKKIQELTASESNGLVINPGAFSHYSIAILDALKILKIPIVEVHLTQLYQRESFRQRMLTGEAASIIMTGLKEHSYYHGALALLSLIK